MANIRLCQPILVLFSLLSISNGAEILALFPIHGISNYNAAEALLKALASRGHNVTVVTSFIQKTPVPNLHEIDISKSTGQATNSIHFDRVRTALQDVKLNFKNMERLSKVHCQAMFTDPRVLSLRDKKFDLVINAIFGSDCDVGFAWKSRAPLISILNARHTPWSFYRVGNPTNPSYMPVIHSRFPVEMNFVQRLINTAWQLYFLFTYYYQGNGEDTNKMARKFVGADMPDVNEIAYNTSLVFVNTHFSIDMAYPLVPNCIEIGGIHVKEPKPLPPVSIMTILHLYSKSYNVSCLSTHYSVRKGYSTAVEQQHIQGGGSITSLVFSSPVSDTFHQIHFCTLFRDQTYKCLQGHTGSQTFSYVFL